MKRTPMTRTRMRRSGIPAAAIPEAVRLAVVSRDESRCQMCGMWVANVPSSLHHRLPRRMGGRRGAAAAASYDMAVLVLLCGNATTPGSCHLWAESNRGQAYDDGWLIREGDDPRTVPCLTYRGWEQPGETWEIA